MAGDGEESLSEDLRGFPFESRMGADAPLGSWGGLRVEGEGGEVERVKGTWVGAECSSREDESSSWGM